MRHRDEPEDLDERTPVDPKRMREALALTAARPVIAPEVKPDPYNRPEPSPCRVCGELAAILHALPDEGKRTVCARCQGKAARDRLTALRDAARTLRLADDEREPEAQQAIATIQRLDNFPRETIERAREERAERVAQREREQRAEAPKPRRRFQ